MLQQLRPVGVAEHGGQEAGAVHGALHVFGEGIEADFADHVFEPVGGHLDGVAVAEVFWPMLGQL